MAESAQAAREAPGGPFVISRTFDAPRELVWKAWTEPERMARWGGPKGCTLTIHQHELRPGGIHHYAQQSPDGSVMWGKVVYREIVPPERLVYLQSFADAEGRTARAPFAETWPLEMLSTITLTVAGEGTTVTVAWEPHNATEAERATFDAARPSMRGGWTGTLDTLGAYLAEAKEEGK